LFLTWDHENRSILKQLNISPENPYFETPHIPDGKVFGFADVPHLLKLVRNHLLDYELHLSDGRMISRASLDALVEIQTGQLKVGWKLSKALLNFKGSERQNVKAAAKVLSWNTARAILFAGNKNLLKGKNEENNY